MMLEVCRTYEVKRVQTYRVEAPEGFDPSDDVDFGIGFGEFDDYVCAHGTLVSEEHEFVDHDDLSIDVSVLESRLEDDQITPDWSHLSTGDLLRLRYEAGVNLRSTAPFPSYTYKARVVAANRALDHQLTT